MQSMLIIIRNSKTFYVFFVLNFLLIYLSELQLRHHLPSHLLRILLHIARLCCISFDSARLHLVILAGLVGLARLYHCENVATPLVLRGTHLHIQASIASVREHGVLVYRSL